MQSVRAKRERSPTEPMYLPADASFIDRLRAGMTAYRALQKSQEDPVAAALMSASLDGDIFRREAERLAKTEVGRTLLAERPALHRDSVDLESLARLEEGTVGRAFARYYADNGILPFEAPTRCATTGTT